MNELRRRRPKRRCHHPIDDVALRHEWLRYWQARMDQLRVRDVAAELGQLEETSRRLVAWLEQVHAAGAIPSDYARQSFGHLAERERALTQHLKALRTKLEWCFDYEQRYRHR
jgi:hypothetical protein